MSAYYSQAAVAEIVSELLLNHACNKDRGFETTWFSEICLINFQSQVPHGLLDGAVGWPNSTASICHGNQLVHFVCRSGWTGQRLFRVASWS